MRKVELLPTRDCEAVKIILPLSACILNVWKEYT